MPKKKINPMQDIEQREDIEAAESTIAHLNESTVRAAAEGMTLKSGNQIRCTFFVDSGLWTVFKTYAEAKGTTASNLLVRYIDKTVTENQEKIERYAEAKANLMKDFDD